MKIIGLFIGISLHPLVILPAIFAGLFFRSHLWRTIFLIACCSIASVIIKDSLLRVPVRLLGYFAIAYAAYGINHLIQLKRAASLYYNAQRDCSEDEDECKTGHSEVFSPNKRLGMLLASGALAAIVLDFIFWISTKRLADKVWDFLSLGTPHGFAAWLCILVFILGVSVFTGKGKKIVDWIAGRR